MVAQGGGTSRGLMVAQGGGTARGLMVAQGVGTARGLMVAQGGGTARGLMVALGGGRGWRDVNNMGEGGQGEGPIKGRLGSLVIMSHHQMSKASKYDNTPT